MQRFFSAPIVNLLAWLLAVGSRVLGQWGGRVCRGARINPSNKSVAPHTTTTTALGRGCGVQPPVVVSPQTVRGPPMLLLCAIPPRAGARVCGGGCPCCSAVPHHTTAIIDPHARVVIVVGRGVRRAFDAPTTSRMVRIHNAKVTSTPSRHPPLLLRLLVLRRGRATIAGYPHGRASHVLGCLDHEAVPRTVAVVAPSYCPYPHTLGGGVWVDGVEGDRACGVKHSSRDIPTRCARARGWVARKGAHG